MTTLKCVDRSPGKEPPGWIGTKWDEEQQRNVVHRPDDLLDRYHGEFLCTRCYSPLSDDERHLNILKFSKENLMHLPSIDDEGLPQVFRDYWSSDASKSKLAMAEIQLLRMAIPCVQLKVLKHGGVLSKMHSVVVPNKVTKLTKFPLDPAHSGVVFYSKRTKGGGDKKWRVRPKAVRDALKWLARKVDEADKGPSGEPRPDVRHRYGPRPYRTDVGEGGWDAEQLRLVFNLSEADVNSMSADDTVEVTFPTIEHDEELSEDQGPAASQHAARQHAARRVGCRAACSKRAEATCCGRAVTPGATGAAPGP